MQTRYQEAQAKEQPVEGTHLARLVGIIDMGLRPEWMYLGEKQKAEYQLELVYELVGCLMEDGRPFHVSELVKNKLSRDMDSDKITNLTRRIKALGGNQDDLTSNLDKTCQVTIRPNKNGSGYMQIAGQYGVSPIASGTNVKELVNPTYVFDLEKPDLDIFLNFPEFKQNRIKENLEFKGSALQTMLDRIS